MREIKFRAWVKDWSERQSEDEPNKINGMYRVRGLWQSNSSVKYADLESFKEGSVELWGFRSSVRIDTIYLMQYTGLKDKNGKEIYEGDIVTSDVQYGWIMQIVWGGPWHYAGFVQTNLRYKPEYDYTHFCSSDHLNPEWAKDLEVIGNIYQNPELINNQKEK